MCLASTSAEPRGDPRGQVPATPLLPKALLAGQSVFPTSFYHCHPLSISTREPAALETCGWAHTCCCEAVAAAPRSADGTGAACAGSPTGLGLRPPPKEADKSPARQTFLGGCATAQNGSSTPFEDASRVGALYLSRRGFGFVFPSFFFFFFLFPLVCSFICTSSSPLIFLFPIFNHPWERVPLVTYFCDMPVAFTLFYSCTVYLLIYNFIPKQIDVCCSLSSSRRFAIA